MNKSPFKVLTSAGIGAIAGVVGGLGQFGVSLAGRGDRIREQNEAEAENRKMMNQYRDLDTSNIYANVRNPYENIETEFQNVYEDLTVNQQQAQFEKQMAQQQQSNIMQDLRGAAGGSGIAGLAQAMANQGQIQAQRASASIGMQESQNQRLAAQGAQQAIGMEQQALRTQMAGAAQAQQMRLQGEEQSRALDYQKTGTMLGMSQQRLASANQARQLAAQQQMSAVGQIASVGMQAMDPDVSLFTSDTGVDPGTNNNDNANNKNKKKKEDN
jgi:hypothetical protein